MMLKERYGSLTFEIEEKPGVSFEEMESVACPADLCPVQMLFAKKTQN